MNVENKVFYNAQWLYEMGWKSDLPGLQWFSPYGWPDPMTYEEALDFEECCQGM